jgi:2-C-methyl-D-erythritol 4-phosphate cytidylyltransferase / 2-C-methyl-D-erythritol 2,4-cyclodiphosphate synthase
MQQKTGFAAIVAAAGQGERAGPGLPKQLRLLRGRPVLAWSVEALLKAAAGEVIVVTAPDLEAACRAALGPLPARFVAGGATRTASVRAGLVAIAGAEAVLIHDAARPGLTPAVVERLLAALAAGAEAAAPALAAADALWRADAEGRALASVARAGLMQVQTPQAFALDRLRAAYAAAPADAAFEDDLAVLRADGGAAVFVAGDRRLMKFTYEEDLAMLELLLGGETCVGTGFDAHRFGPGDYVTLCGVRIAHERGLIGHSDADAGWHALIDAILGALGEGDIGAHFPPSDPRWRGADSALFLRHARDLAAAAGARIAHVDITLICEQPKLSPHREAMRARTAEALGIALARVSVKATTTEGMGFAGRSEGLAAQAVATLDRPVR